MRFLILIIIFCLTPIQLYAATTESNSLHLDWLDKKIDPKKDFFTFANGNWQKKNPIPAAYPSWNNFHILHEQNQKQIRTLLENAAKNTNNTQGSTQQLVGDFYFSGMDEKTIEKTTTKPLQTEFDNINKISNLSELQSVITHLQMIGVNAVFDFGQMQDFKDSNQVIGVAAQGGLGLPDRDYYLKNDKKFKKLRQIYVQHITKMFELLGDDKNKSAAQAKTVLKIETILAKNSMSRIAQRDPHAIYHPMNLTELQKITPNFSWEKYFSEIGHPEIKNINLAMPDFFKTMNDQFTKISLNDWKIYLRWHVIHSFAPFVSKSFVNESFHLASAISGVKELLPRWKRVVNAEDGALGFAVGKLYVENYFPEKSKQRVQEIINNIRNVQENDLKQLAWMTPETRKAALNKLSLMKERVGYPDKWRDYSALKIDRGPYVLNIIRVNEFLNKRELNKIGKPVDKDEWDMTPQTVNAYYDPSMNMLNIPAGILQPPFFEAKAPAAINYGAIGFVIGHEMTHGFDDQGAQFDGQGNLKNWWSKEDLKKFQLITKKTSQQFSKYTVNKNLHIQGELVKGEATADFGGLTLAYRAFHSSNDFKQAKTIHGFTPDQQFFLGAAHVWAANIRPEESQRLIITDPHPPAMYRVNGTLENMPEFHLTY